MSRVSYASTIGRMMSTMECSNISHVVGVVSGHMEKTGKDHGNECFGILEARVSPRVDVVILSMVMMIQEIWKRGDLPQVQVIDGGGVVHTPYWSKLCRHVHVINIVREATMVFGFSWLAGKVMIDSLGKVSGKLFSRWRLLGGDNAHLAVTIRLEASQEFGFSYAWKCLIFFLFKCRSL
jgi:hypothetical protein